MAHDAFGRFVGHLGVPVVIVTATDGEERAGCLVSFHTQISIQPSRYLVGLSPPNHTFRVAERAEHLAVHTLGRDRRDLALLFGGQTGDEIDKFAQCRWRPWRDGTPLLEDAVAWFVGKPLSWHDLGDHHGVVLAPLDAAASNDLPLLRTRDVADLRPGHPP